MTEPEEHDEDLFADLYEGDDTPAKPVQPAAPVAQPLVEPAKPVPSAPPAVKHEEPPQPEEGAQNGQHDYYPRHEQSDVHMNGGWGDGNAHHAGGGSYDDNYGPIGIKEDGKMFIGGLNWDTTDQSLKDYFSQFGEVTECTVMRDGATGRSRGFGFLTFRDPKTVNIVMVKEHYLDGKIIDPKRAIPREEQERTAKIFVGGVSQDATERDFREFFQQFGRVIDATLMMDKDTGRPRGFGFVTFDGAAAVDACLSGPLEILGKPIEVKPAQPRSNMRDGEDDKGGKYGRGRNDRFQRGHENQDNYSNQQSQNQNQNQNQQAANGATNGMSPAMMAQYWQRMQQYFQMMQQNMQAQMGQGQGMGPNPMAMQGQMNPAMMQQMMAMQQMNRPGGSPHPQSPGAGPMPGIPSNGQMNPAMMQQMQQIQQMQMQQQASQGAGPGTFSPGPGMMAGQAAGPNRPGFNAQEQLMFEQQKYEQQQARRVQQQQFAQHHQYNTGGPTSWEGMYDDVPQPNLPPQGPGARGGMQGNFGGHVRQMSPAQSGRGGMQHRGSQGSTPPVQPSNAPANAPTGPKNAGKPGANYRGGGRAGHRGFHPYARNG